MAKKTNYIDRHGNPKYRLQRKVGMRLNKKGEWVPHIKSFYGSCRKEAEEKYIAYMAESHIEQSRMVFKCLGEALDAFAENVFKKSELANATKKKYLAAYNNLLQDTPLAGRPVNEVTALDLQKIYNDLTQCYSTRRALHNFLRQFYQYAELNGICGDITGSLIIPKGETKPTEDEIEVWDEEDVKAIIQALEGNTLRLLIVLAVNTGARFAELLALKYSDISDGMLTINKQLYEISPIDDKDNVILHMEPVKSKSSNRSIPLSGKVVAEIEKHQRLQQKMMRKHHYQNNGYLFTTSNGTLYYKRNIVRSLKRLYNRIGVPYHKFHAYRHTFGTNLSRAGVPIEVTSKLMGHASIDVTAKYYINIEAERRREAIEKITRYSFSTAEDEETNS